MTPQEALLKFMQLKGEPLMPDVVGAFYAGWDAHAALAPTGTTDVLALEEGIVPSPPITAEMIYQAYPRKVGRGPAIKAINKALKTVAAVRLLALTEAFSAAYKLWPENDKRFACHPATFFNGEHYNDDQKEWVRYAGVAPKSQFGHSH